MRRMTTSKESTKQSAPRRPAMRGPRLGVWIGIFGALLLLASGCSLNFLTSLFYEKPVIKLDERFSQNLAIPLPTFKKPNKKRPPAHAEVLERRGVPDCVRVWWRRDGTLITSSDHSGRRNQIAEMLRTNKQSWIYLDEDEEVVFQQSGAGYQVQPISAILKLIAKYGDPSERNPPVIRNGHIHETWRWYDHGLQIELVDGKEDPSLRMRFQATGAGTFIAK